MSQSRLRRWATSAAALAVAAGSLTLATAPAAHADGELSITGPATAAPGSSVTVTATGNFQLGTVVLLSNGSQLGSSVNIGMPPPPNAVFTFTMPSSSVNVMAENYSSDGYSPVGNSNTLTINATSSVATSTTITAPNIAKVGSRTQISVGVSSASGNVYVPKGNVIVRDQNGNSVATIGLSPQGTASSYGYFWWTPSAAGTYVFTAYYQGDGVAQPSTSPADAINASASGNTISLAAPATATAGTSITLTASVVPSTLQGSVGFTYNGKPISASIPLVNGQASMNWVATGSGNNVLGASYTTNGGASGSTTSAITINPGPVQSDSITLTQPGYGTWAPNGTYNLGKGSSFTFQASTLSGAPVSLSVTGPCTVSGLTLSVNGTGASCQLTAKSTGQNGFGPVTQNYTVNTTIGQQTATLAAPPSGRVNKGKAIVLEAPGQADTNAGQNIVWKVAKPSKKICKLGFPSDGSVTVKLTKRGQCTVTGKAPGVQGQWAPFVVQRTYTA